jgi:TrmH family RNA methyltransferase
MMNHKTLSKLHQKKYRNQYNLFLVEGKKSVQDAFASSIKVEQVCVSKTFSNEQKAFLSNLGTKDFRDRSLTILDDYTFSRLSSAKTPSGILAVIKKPESNFELITQDQVIPVLEDLRDPGNMGTILRTADWFGVKSVILIGGADPFQSKVVQSSMGSIFKLNIIEVSNPNEIIQKLKDKGFQLVVTRPEFAKKTDADKTLPKSPNKIAVVFGNESHGTSTYVDKQADEFWSIPSFGSAESLNVAVSFGIFLYEFKK